MKYTIIWKEHFRLSNREDRSVTVRREYDDEQATKKDVAAYIKLRMMQQYIYSVEQYGWTDRSDGKKYNIGVHSFTNGNDTHTMWVGPSLLA